MNATHKNTLKRFVNNFEEFARDEEIVKIKTVVDMANDFNLGVDKAHIQELLEVIPEELANEELLEAE